MPNGEDFTSKKNSKPEESRAVGGSSDRLAALSGGTVDATPLDVAYLQRTEQLGLSSVVYLGDVVDLRLDGLAVATEKIDKNPDQIRRMMRAT